MTFLLDTNILVYSVDANEPDKRARATALLQRLDRQIERYEQIFLVLALTPAIVLEALRGVRDHQAGARADSSAPLWRVGGHGGGRRDAVQQGGLLLHRRGAQSRWWP